jgi:hypothetical protein
MTFLGTRHRQRAIGRSIGWIEIHDQGVCITLLAVDREISNRLLEECPETGLSSASVGQEKE